MTDRKIRLFFWGLLAVQVIGAATFLWKGLPIYRRLLSAPTENAESDTLLLECFIIVGMQLAYWLAYPLQPQIRFRRHPVLAHVLLWLGDLSSFFPAALAALCLFDRLQDMEEARFFPERVVLLAGILFAMFCFKHQLELLAGALEDSESEDHRTNESARIK